MGKTFPKDIMDCMKECILSIFWPKKDIIDFFKNSGCTGRELLSESVYDKMFRNSIVDTMFDRLEARNDGGIGQFRSMLMSLTQWDYFNSYYFDTIKKLNRNIAKRNINHLKQLQEIRDSRIKQERQKREEFEKKSKEINTTINDLKNIFLKLFSSKDEAGKAINLQQRGYLFEDFLRKLCLFEKLEVTEPFKIVGEQIDGSIKYDGEHYIIEAKWNDKLSASNDLYQFAHKVEGKMYGRGIFISVNGFSDASVSALQNGKALKTVLVDGGDIVLVTEEMYTFRKMLDMKIKAAQTMGRIYVDSLSMKEKCS
ncbi:hypothetical protein Dtox_2222 [Desulfofarcimen acetoxidans DSM 771]|uniref:Restriction endonuclease type IV Mrr domain-containing protein n=1 Tax=Desulfofarcimen acetoxidans (strain ATCC 49208 / DSM 771 / KCTC 5769 / VKM B-1644 / 5575) TaxID=485916 RepID=C8VZR1_DESAS|nr:restriction endonuclease [Desulfofarcimen acetoxidans]ACV63039.1 hypothetical protein Dtox_2222 [Desulfofarcimen acetoxidans DSM 771]